MAESDENGAAPRPPGAAGYVAGSRRDCLWQLPGALPLRNVAVGTPATRTASEWLTMPDEPGYRIDTERDGRLVLTRGAFTMLREDT